MYSDFVNGCPDLTFSNQYFLLFINLGIDMFFNRRMYWHLGRKYCLSNEIKQEFKKIKECKRQQKEAMKQLAYMKVEMELSKHQNPN